MNSDTFDFYEIVINLDNSWAENGVTGDAYDMYEELVCKYGENNKDIIKEAIEEYYQIFLDQRKESE